MSPYLLLLVYCAVLTALALLGGWLPARWNWNHVRIQLVMSFIAGFMLAVALIQLLPHAFGILNDGRTLGVTVLAGLLVMFFLIRIFDYHHHHFADTQHDGLSCAHDHDHTHEVQPLVALAGLNAKPVSDSRASDSRASDSRATVNGVAGQGSGVSGGNSYAWLGLLMGLGLHSIIEAVALAAALRAGMISDAALLKSLGIFLAIALHKPLDAMSIASVMTVGQWTPSERTWVNGVYAVSGPLAAVLAFFGFYWIPADTTLALGFALAFSAGTFLCISLGDLLPELHFHSHDRGKLSVCLLAGVGLVVLLEWVPFFNHGTVAP